MINTSTEFPNVSTAGSFWCLLHSCLWPGGLTPLAACRYELHHGVRIADTALVSAAVLADRYISDRFLPDKAIDLVDESAAKLKMEITSKPTALDEVDRSVIKLEMEKLSVKNDTDRASKERLARLDDELTTLKTRQAELTAQWEHEKSVMTRIQSIKEEMDRVNVEIQQSERDYDLNRAAELKYGSLITLQKQLEQAEAALAAYQSSGASMLREEVTEADIAEIVSRWTGIPISKLQVRTAPLVVEVTPVSLVAYSV